MPRQSLANRPRIARRIRFNPYRRDLPMPPRRVERDLMQTVDYRNEDPTIPLFIMALPTINEVDETAIDNLNVALHPALENIPHGWFAGRPALTRLVIELAHRFVHMLLHGHAIKKTARDEEMDTTE